MQAPGQTGRQKQLVGLHLHARALVDALANGKVTLSFSVAARRRDRFRYGAWLTTDDSDNQMRSHASIALRLQTANPTPRSEACEESVCRACNLRALPANSDSVEKGAFEEQVLMPSLTPLMLAPIDASHCSGPVRGRNDQSSRARG